MKSLLLLALLTLAACGDNSSVDCFDGCVGHPSPESLIAPLITLPITNKFHSSAGLHNLNDIDLRYPLNTQIDVHANCTGTAYGNVGLVNGVDRGFVELQGDEFEGIIQYGHLPYLSPTDNLCKSLSKEGYKYKMTGNTMKLCMINYLNVDGTYKYCADYTVTE